MTKEILFSVILVFGGFGALLFGGVPRRSLFLSTILSLPIGVSIYTFGSALSYALNINRNDIGLYFMIGIALIGFYRFFRRGSSGVSVLGVFPLSALLVAGLMVLAKFLVAPFFSYDSYRIIAVGKLLGSSGFSFDSSGIASFPLMIINFQAGGDLFDLDYVVYLPVVTGLLAVVGATVIIFNAVSDSKNQTIICSLMSLLLLSVFGGITFMLRSQLGYLNSHLLMAGYYTLGFAFCLDAMKESQFIQNRFFSALVIGSVAFIRLEGLLFTALLLFALMSLNVFSKKQLLQIGLVALLVPGAWYMRLAAAGVSSSAILTPRNTVIMLLVVSSPLFINWCRQTQRFAGWMPRLAVVGLSVILSIYLLIQDTATESTLMLVSNSLATGRWGSFWWTFGPLVILMAFFGPRLKREDIWLEVLWGGFLVVLLLGVIRSSPYRTGWGDSGNRMLIHLVPLVVTYTVFKVNACFKTGDEIVDEANLSDLMMKK